MKIFLTIILALAFGLSHAQQETARSPALTKVNIQSQEKGPTVVLLMDVTGSFVDHLLANDNYERAKKRIKLLLTENVQQLSHTRVATIGHSHRDVTGTYDHLLAKNWMVGKNQPPKERVASLMLNHLDDMKSALESGKIKKQENTAVAQAFDQVAEWIRLDGAQQCVIIAISDMDETEFTNGLPPPARDGQLKNCKVYAIGAAVTVTSTNGQRKLRGDWEKYFKRAGVVMDDFYWITNP
jgi:hypothetical protein